MEVPNTLISFDNVIEDNDQQENRDENSSSSHDGSHIELTVIRGVRNWRNRILNLSDSWKYLHRTKWSTEDQ